ncbi:MAG: hypothetical protein ACLFRI_04735 [Candidatus Izemoplasmataceae bacterium]
MKSLIKFQYAYLFTKKTQWLMGLFIGLTLVILLSQSQFQLSFASRIIYQETLATEYYFEMVELYKQSVIILMIYLIYQIFVKNSCDILLIQRTNRLKVFFSKHIIGLVVIGLYSLYYQSVYGISATVLSIPVTQETWINAVLYSLIFALIYYHLLLVIILLSHHLFSLLLVYLAMNFGNILIDYLVDIDSLSFFKRLYIMIFPNIHILSDQSLSLINSLPYVIFYILVLKLASVILFYYKEF